MTLDSKLFHAIDHILEPNERVELAVRQRRFGLGGSLINPAGIAVTDRRVIIVNSESMGLKIDYEIILFREISNVRLEKMVGSASLFIRTRGYGRSTEALMQHNKMEEGEIDGLTMDDAKEIVSLINKKVLQVDLAQSPAAAMAQENDEKKHVHCPSCGAKNPPKSKFCMACGYKLTA